MAPHASAARHKHRVLPNPYEFLPKVPSFSLTSRTVHSGYPLPRAQWSGVLGEPGGKDESPQLSWRGFPEGTKSFVVSMYDPEAPTGSGFWHWVVANIPASAHTLRLNAGAPGGNLLPHGAFDLDASLGVPRYIGAAPPAGSGLHYYYITVTALNEASTGATATTSPELLGFEIGSHTLARATIICPTSAHSPFSRAGSHSA
ncbi:MAG TPA: YbhB/YbcL family Raf kinase inhibitor-like protein [Streptosporangiaceae bacterium]|nr:YbhB/YbcL family Raf kinase inhibitor-like protein [Streptosporangiaceae bacterium]